MTRLPRAQAGLVGLAAIQAGCVAVIALFAHATAGKAAVDDQRTWLVLAIAAVATSGLANGAWLIAARRALARRRATLLGRLDLAVASPAVGLGRASGGPVADELVRVPGMRLVHRPGCALVRGKATVAASGGPSCGWCRS